MDVGSEWPCVSSASTWTATASGSTPWHTCSTQ
jgi:hypothetical protein